MSDWWRGAVIYQIYPRSFQDSNGDGIGDLRGITERLPYVADLGVDAIWLSPIFTSPMADMGYDVCDYTDIDPIFGTLADFDAMVARAHELGLKVIIDQVLSHSSDRAPVLQGEPAEPGQPQGRLVRLGRPEARRHAAEQLAVGLRRRRLGLGRAAAAVLPAQLPRRAAGLQLPQPRGAGLAARRPCASGWSAASTASGSTPSTSTSTTSCCATTRRTSGARTKPEWNPYAMQYHLFSKNQPENLAFLERMRMLLDEYEARAMVGEMGESHHAIRMMGEYTTGRRLHKSYSFEMLDDRFDAAHFRGQIEEFYAGAPGGWPTWAFSNHDVVRHVTRWARHGIGREPLAKLAGALLLSLEGSICVYQGDELGQTETELEFYELTDPQGIRFWPENKGRDGCRTPMVWDAAEPNCGFSTGRPVAAGQGGRRRRIMSRASRGEPDSVLEFYRAMLKLRRETEELRTGRTRVLRRRRAGPRLHPRRHVLCVFNLSPETHEVRLTGGGAMALARASSTGDGC